MSEFFISQDISKEQESFLHRVLNLGMDFIKGDVRQDRVLIYAEKEELRKLFSNEIPVKSSDLESLLEDLVVLASYSISQSDPRFLAFPDSAGSIATYAADIMASFLNQNLIAVDRSAPAATFIETQLIAWLRYLIGYTESSLNPAQTLSEIGGMWTSGGNMSNYIAILTALIHQFPEVQSHGLYKLKKRPVMILSRGIAHYSFLNAAKSLGLGSEGVLWLDTDADFKTSSESLEQLLKNLPEDVEPFMVVAVAGNCRTSSIDPIEKMARICQKHCIWLHVDACHGGSLLFSEKLSQGLKGIAYADSVTIDPHKGLFVTYSSSYILFKNTETLNYHCRYKGMVDNPAVYDLGLITPFYGSRGFDSLKLWLMIRHMGTDKIGVYVEKRNALYQVLITKLQEQQLFVLFNQAEFYRSVFVFYPSEVQKYVRKIHLSAEQQIHLIQKYTRLFSDMLYRRGKVILDLFQLNDFGNVLGLGKDVSYDVIGLSMGHPHIEKQTIEEIVLEISNVGQSVTEKFIQEVSGKPGLATDTKSERFRVRTNISPASW